MGAKSQATIRREKREQAVKARALGGNIQTNRSGGKAGGARMIAEHQLRRQVLSQAEIRERVNGILDQASIDGALLLHAVILGEIEGASVTNRVTAAQTVLDKRGFGALERDEGKTINTMKRHELEEFVRGGAERLNKIRQQSQAVTVDQQSPTVEPD